jgi:hypothetical protein
MSFIKKLQSQAKVRAVRAKIRKAEAAKKKLSGEYKRVLKSEAGRLSKIIKKFNRSKKAKKRR